VIGGTALTSREVQVLEGIALGQPNSAICADLHLSPNTVKSIIRNAYRKLGVTSRSQAVAWCLEQGFDGWQRDEMR
jgi:DNA-binding NarL/FixJ family response regulator